MKSAPSALAGASRQNPLNIHAHRQAESTRTLRSTRRACLALALTCSLVASVTGADANSPLAPCPPDHILLPCSCAVSEIYCYNQNVVHLKPIFQRVSNYLSELGSTKQFIKLELDGLAVPYLEANFLSGLSFEIVALKNLRYLRAIDKRAFESAANRLQQLSLEEDTSRFVSETNLAQINALIRSLPSLTRLYLDAYDLHKIPKHVFAHDNLQDLSFNYNRKKKGHISTVEEEAFYYLPSLQTVDLYNQSIGHIPRSSFRFQQDNHDLTMAVFLQDNLLTSTSFESGLFATGRKLRVLLGQNNITYVEREAFEPFFSANVDNVVDLGPSQLRMDCHNQWVGGVESRYKQILSGVVTIPGEDHKVLVNLEAEDYVSLGCAQSN